MSKLTGRLRYRTGAFGKVVLQVEEHRFGMPAYSRHVGCWTDWRDADVQDLVSGAIRQPDNSHIADLSRAPSNPPSGGSSAGPIASAK